MADTYSIICSKSTANVPAIVSGAGTALASNSDLLSDIKSSFLFTNPNASPEKTNASTIKIFNDLQRQKIKLQWK